MEITFSSPSVRRCVRAISSKSEAHRALICASLSDSETKIICTDTNADIDAIANCDKLNAIAADCSVATAQISVDRNVSISAEIVEIHCVAAMAAAVSTQNGTGDHDYTGA